MRAIKKTTLLISLVLLTATMGLTACSGNSGYPGQYERSGGGGHGGHSH